MSEASTPENKPKSPVPLVIASILLIVGLSVMQMAC